MDDLLNTEEEAGHDHTIEQMLAESQAYANGLLASVGRPDLFVHYADPLPAGGAPVVSEGGMNKALFQDRFLVFGLIDGIEVCLNTLPVDRATALSQARLQSQWRGCETVVREFGIANEQYRAHVQNFLTAFRDGTDSLPAWGRGIEMLLDGLYNNWSAVDLQFRLVIQLVCYEAIEALFQFWNERAGVPA